MSWKSAFLAQAASDNRIRHLLDDVTVPYSHRLHYLQMATEKLAKGWLATEGNPAPPVPTHSGLVRLLQTLKGRPDVRRELGIRDASVFRAFVESLLDLADQIESLAPSAAGFGRPNPEYPWREPATGLVVVPAEFAFPAFDPRGAKMVKLDRLIDDLFSLAT